MICLLVIMFVVSIIVVLVVSIRVISILKRMANSRYRVCEFVITKDQYEDLMDILNEMSRKIGGSKW